MGASGKITVFGYPQSTFVRTVRMTLEEKGAPYGLAMPSLSKPGYEAIHPFRRMPEGRHGEFHLFESLAIARYVDAAIPGPALQPSDLRARAVMDQWISAISDYLYRDAIRDFVLQYVFPKGLDGAPDETVILAARPRIGHDLAVLDGALACHEFLVGPDLTLADLFLAPIVAYLPAFPGGDALMAPCPRLSRWIEAMAKRPSFVATIPPRFPG
jgi:glutathione S-transferase